MQLGYVKQELAPSGTLRAAINVGNPVLVQKDEESGELSGITLDIAGELSNGLGLPHRIEEFYTAGNVADLAVEDRWDVAFLAIDPIRTASIDFTEPYVGIGGCYMVTESSPITSADEVDRPDNRISVGSNTAADLHLSRSIRKAELIRTDRSIPALECYRDQRLEVTAGLRQALESFLYHPDHRILPGPFMLIRHAMAVPNGRHNALTYLDRMLVELRASGFLARALAMAGQTNAF